MVNQKDDALDALSYALEAGFTPVKKVNVDIVKVEKVGGLTFGVQMSIDLGEFSYIEREGIKAKIDKVQKELESMVEAHIYNRIKNNLDREF